MLAHKIFFKKEKKYGAHSHVRATARLVSTHYSQQRSAVRSTAKPNKKQFITKIGFECELYVINCLLGAMMLVVDKVVFIRLLD